MKWEDVFRHTLMPLKGPTDLSDTIFDPFIKQRVHKRTVNHRMVRYYSKDDAEVILELMYDGKDLADTFIRYMTGEIEKDKFNHEVDVIIQNQFEYILEARNFQWEKSHE